MKTKHWKKTTEDMDKSVNQLYKYLIALSRIQNIINYYLVIALLMFTYFHRNDLFVIGLLNKTKLILHCAFYIFKNICIK